MKPRRVLACGCVLLSLLTGVRPVSAEPYDVRIPLEDGRVHLRSLAERSGLPVDSLRRFFDVDSLDAAVDVTGLRGSLLVAALTQASLGGWSMRIEPDALIMSVDPDKLPANQRQLKESARRFTTELTPESSATQARRMGLQLPANLDPARPLVIVIHGLDGLKFQVRGLVELLEAAGAQVGVFAYPSDQPLNDSVALLRRHLAAVRDVFPSMPLQVVAHSMGGLVARAVVEGEGYPGGVERMILVATPNGGSEWARLRVILEAKEHYELWRHDAEWNWSWAITDGLGEAGEDLTPGSEFLAGLQSLPRRDGVRYTVIVGDRDEGNRIIADAIDSVRQTLPDPLRRWTGLAALDRTWADYAAHLRDADTGADGPVTLESAGLEGVNDVVMVHADHSRLIVGDGESSPAAWDAIRQRLLPSP